MRRDKQQQKDISPRMLKMRFSVVFLLFVAILFSIIIYNYVQQIQEATSVISATAGMPILNQAKSFIDGDKYERLAATLDESDPFYIETQAKFRELREESNCLFLYTTARTHDDVHFYIFDGEDPESELFSPIGSVEAVEDYEREYMLAFETKTFQITQMVGDSKWGRFVSAFMPILNSNGDVVGIIGVDFDAEGVYQTIMSNLRIQVIFALVFAIAGLVLTLYFFRDIERIYIKINAATHDLSRIDSLTEIRNRRYLDETFPTIISQISRMEDGVLSVLLIDVDFFKLYNDTYGHERGDECLRRVAQTLAGTLYRASDVAARYGGEEFIIILPYTGKDGAVVVAKKLLQCIRELGIAHEESPVAPHVTISVGVMSTDVLHTHEWQDYLKRADEALYMSKESGRNTFTYLDFNTAG